MIAPIVNGFDKQEDASRLLFVNAATRPALQLPGIGTEANDYLLDLACSLPAVARRTRNMTAAHNKGHDACEVCGRALKGGRVECMDAAGTMVATLGPDCARKIAALLAAG